VLDDEVNPININKKSSLSKMTS